MIQDLLAAVHDMSALMDQLRDGSPDVSTTADGIMDRLKVWR